MQLLNLGLKTSSDIRAILDCRSEAQIPISEGCSRREEPIGTDGGPRNSGSESEQPRSEKLLFCQSDMALISDDVLSPKFSSCNKTLPVIPLFYRDSRIGSTWLRVLASVNNSG